MGMECNRKKVFEEKHECFSIVVRITVVTGLAGDSLKDAKKLGEKVRTDVSFLVWFHDARSPHMLKEGYHQSHVEKTSTRELSTHFYGDDFESWLKTGHFKTYYNKVLSFAKLTITSYKDVCGNAIKLGDILSLNGETDFETTCCGEVREFKGEVVCYYGNDIFDELSTVNEDREVIGNISTWEFK